MGLWRRGWGRSLRADIAVFLLLGVVVSTLPWLTGRVGFLHFLMAFILGLLVGFLIGRLGPGERSTGWGVLSLVAVGLVVPWFVIGWFAPFPTVATYNAAYIMGIVTGLFRYRALTRTKR